MAEKAAKHQLLRDRKVEKILMLRALIETEELLAVPDQDKLRDLHARMRIVRVQLEAMSDAPF